MTTAPADHPSDQTNRFIGILVTLSLILLLLLLVEGGVRVRQWWLYGTLSHFEEVKRFDAQVGLDVPTPGFSSRTIQINALGFRGPELTQPKPAGTVRLAFLGGSTTFCAEVSGNENVWPHLVWKRLQEQHPQIRMDYVNGGVTAYTTQHSLTNLQKRVAPLQPDLIVIYHATNDMSLETRALAAERGLVSKPFTNSWLGRYSLFWFLIEKNLQIHSVQTRQDHLTSLPDHFGQPFAANLTRLVQEAQKVARLVALVTWSHQMRPERTPQENRLAAASSLYHMPFLTPELLMEGFARYNEVIRQVARHTGAVLIGDENRIPGDALHFNDSVHFTNAGSRVMGERVSDGVLASDLWHAMITERTTNPSHQKE